MKVVINKCYGGFGISKEAISRYCEIKGIQSWIEEDKKYKSLGIWTCWLVPPEKRVKDQESNFASMSTADRISYNKKWAEQTLYYRDIERNDPALVQVVEELGEKANGRYANLRVVEIPDDVAYEIDDYDGMESISEVHRTWY